MNEYYSIGEFSTVTGLSVKTLRFYHEQGILIPSSVDESSGYRYYDSGKIDKARVIMRLRELEFSLEDIAAILRGCEDEADVLNYLERQKTVLQQRMREDRDVVRALSGIISREADAREMLRRATHSVTETVLPTLIVAGIRLKGKYSECGAAFGRIGKLAGRHLAGKPFCLHYDDEFRDGDADFEACFPLRAKININGLTVRELPGGRGLALIHRGPYDQLGRSYAKILAQARTRKLSILRPTREIYHKGPGMIFKGNPKNYLTEIQLPFAD